MKYIGRHSKSKEARKFSEKEIKHVVMAGVFLTKTYR